MNKNSQPVKQSITIITHGQQRPGGKRPLGLVELVAIAVGGMIGGGIFSVLGIAVANVGYAAIYSLFIGGILALISVYSYAKLAKYYKDEGASYSFFKRTYPNSHGAASIIGWIVAFGYISTLALYAATFGSYFASIFNYNPITVAKIAGSCLLLGFTLINIISVKGMGIIEDFLVYIKLIAIVAISFLFTLNMHHNIALKLVHPQNNNGFLRILTIAAITFVAYEGFQLAIHAFRDSYEPEKTVPRAMYIAIGIVIITYLVLAIGALSSLPINDIIKNKEFALAAGAQVAIGKIGYFTVIMSALFATTSALSGTLYGASRLISVISTDGYMPKTLSLRSSSGIPRASVITMATLALLLLLSGTLQKILEFGSFTFMASSLLIAIACLKVYRQAQASRIILLISIGGLAGGLVLLTLFQFSQEPKSLVYTFGIYALLGILAFYFKVYAARHKAPS
jgi:amino acid transporter